VSSIEVVSEAERGPRLKRSLTVVAHSADRVELRSGVWNPASVTLSDETQSGALLRIISRLDGSISPRRLAAEEDLPREDVERVIDHLMKAGAIEEEATTALDHYLEQSLSWTLAVERDAPPLRLLGDAALGARLAELLGDSLLDAELDGRPDPLWDQLGGDVDWLDDGLRFRQRLERFNPWSGRLLAVASATVDPVRMRALNRVCLALGVPWLHAAIDGPFVFVGPLVVPRRSACYECLETRITMNLRQGASYAAYKRALAERRARQGDLPLLPAVGGLLAGHASLELLNFALTGATFTVGKVLAIYLPTMEISFNEVLRVPGCAGCGTLSDRDGAELYFDAAAVLNGGA
jgi:bacteriocin biosynthesis cyclodehydratase domain-containing protein